MKRIVFYMLLATLFVACDNKSEITPDLTSLKIKDDPCETLEYLAKIGNDFDSALDSLKKLKSIPPEEIRIGSLEVVFDYDTRQFHSVEYGDCGLYSDVLDTKGHHYLRSWYAPNCPEE